MSGPFIRIPVGVVVERRKAVSEWADLLWRPVAVLAGMPDAAPWTALAADADAVTYYAGPAEIALYRSETESYRRNLASDVPVVWVALHATGTEPPYTIGGVTADPAEGEGWTEPGGAIVEAVMMPQPVREEVEAFVARCPGRPGFVKRLRDRADPEALARRVPPAGRRDERR
jgi:hypothetical protein